MKLTEVLGKKIGRYRRYLHRNVPMKNGDGPSDEVMAIWLGAFLPATLGGLEASNLPGVPLGIRIALVAGGILAGGSAGGAIAGNIAALVNNRTKRSGLGEEMDGLRLVGAASDVQRVLRTQKAINVLCDRHKHEAFLPERVEQEIGQHIREAAEAVSRVRVYGEDGRRPAFSFTRVMHDENDKLILAPIEPRLDALADSHDEAIALKRRQGLVFNIPEVKDWRQREKIAKDEDISPRLVGAEEDVRALLKTRLAVKRMTQSYRHLAELPADIERKVRVRIDGAEKAAARIRLRDERNEQILEHLFTREIYDENGRLARLGFAQQPAAGIDHRLRIAAARDVGALSPLPEAGPAPQFAAVSPPPVERSGPVSAPSEPLADLGVKSGLKRKV
jgi:hypothetical protein